MDKVILEKLKDKLPLPEEIVKAITSQAILTGSVMFVGFTKDSESDYDYIMPPDFQYTWEDLCQYGVVSQVQDYSNEELSSMYVKTKTDRVLNLLFINSNFYNSWVKTSLTMCDMIDNSETIHDLIKNKKYRIKLFETIKDMLIEEEYKSVKLEDYTNVIY